MNSQRIVVLTGARDFQRKSGNTKPFVIVMVCGMDHTIEVCSLRHKVFEALSAARLLTFIMRGANNCWLLTSV